VDLSLILGINTLKNGMKLNITWKIFIGMALGILVGYIRKGYYISVV
jgi:Na+/H+-dicarboxylate symporter